MNDAPKPPFRRWRCSKCSHEQNGHGPAPRIHRRCPEGGQCTFVVVGPPKLPRSARGCRSGACRSARRPPYRAAPIPSEAEIAEACEAIQAGWTKAERKQRRVGSPPRAGFQVYSATHTPDGIRFDPSDLTPLEVAESIEATDGKGSETPHVAPQSKREGMGEQ